MNITICFLFPQTYLFPSIPYHPSTSELIPSCLDNWSSQLTFPLPLSLGLFYTVIHTIAEPMNTTLNLLLLCFKMFSPFKKSLHSLFWSSRRAIFYFQSTSSSLFTRCLFFFLEVCISFKFEHTVCILFFMPGFK